MNDEGLVAFLLIVIPLATLILGFAWGQHFKEKQRLKIDVEVTRCHEDEKNLLHSRLQKQKQDYQFSRERDLKRVKHIIAQAILDIENTWKK